MSEERPTQPDATGTAWYRGWECGFDADAAYWGAEGWRAYKGGADLDAPPTSARSFAGLLDEIDYAEEPECEHSPSHRHQVDTSMEEGPNNCFHCGVSMTTIRRVTKAHEHLRSE